MRELQVRVSLEIIRWIGQIGINWARTGFERNTKVVDTHGNISHMGVPTQCGESPGLGDREEVARTPALGDPHEEGGGIPTLGDPEEVAQTYNTCEVAAFSGRRRASSANCRAFVGRLVAIVVVLATFTVTSCAKPERPVRIFGLSSEGPNGGVDAADQAARALERRLDVINFFVAWEWEQPFPSKTVERIGQLGALPAITWEPWHPAEGPEQPRYALKRIAAGDYDGYIREWARAAASFGQPMQIRFAHEMNGTWYPWSVDVNGNSATDYQDAFRHVHDMFVEAGAVNVEWVWSIDSAKDRAAALTSVNEYYPGDRYVDLVGIDGYNGGPTGVTWDSPEELFGRAIAAAGTVAPDKPAWIYETGSGDELGDKGQWITDLIEYLESTRVTGLIWFNFAKEGEQNWLLDSSPEVENAARVGLAGW